MRRAVVVGAAEIKNYAKVRAFLRKNDFFVFCDGGLSHARKLKVRPNLIVGDFDSHRKPDIDVETITLPKEKDDTDVFFAVKEIAMRGFDEVLLAGVIGQRFDHSLVNISALLYLFNRKITAKIVDDYSILRIVSKTPVEVDGNCAFFSLLNFSGDCRGVTIKNAKYELDRADVKSEYIFSVSNEVLPKKKCEVSVEDGVMVLAEIF